MLIHFDTLMNKPFICRSCSVAYCHDIGAALDAALHPPGLVANAYAGGLTGFSVRSSADNIVCPIPRGMCGLTWKEMLMSLFRTAEPWGTEESRQASYNAELIRRYKAGEPLTKLDKRNARKLIREGR